MVQLVGTTSLGLGKLIDGKNQFVHIRYSAHSNGSNMTTEIQADTKYIGIATNSSETAPTSPSDYSWGRFVGTPGVSSYTWIRYSSNADGSNMTAIPNEETKYIGVAITSEDSAPTDYTKYSWALFKGSDGRGVKKTEVSYQKSTSGTVIPTGTWLASIPSLSDGEYLWTRTLFTYTDGTTTSTYNVSRNGTSGLGIARTDVHYQKSTSGTVAPTGTWTVTIPTVRANEYLWTRTTITYTDDSTSVSYSVGKMGADGKDAQLLYLTASSQIQAFDKDNQPKTTQPITISAKLQNASGTATFTAIPYIGNTAQTPITLGGTGNDRTLLPSQWTDPKWTIIAITATLGSLTDTISVNKVKDGESGETPVVHIAWADSADGSEGFTLELPTNKIPKYRGYYVDYSTTASTDPKKYKWERNPDDTGAEVDKAMTAVESAVANAEEAERLAATASQTATIAKQEASAAQNAASMAQGEVSRIEGVIVGVQGDIDTALQEIADQAADLQATKETLELNYAKKTEVSDVQAALTTEISKKVGELQTTVSQTYAAKNDVVAMEGRLQSQITQTAGEVSSVVGKVDKLEADTTEAQKKVDEALEKSAAAQATANQAQAYADAADRKVTAAQTDLNEAKQNLVNTINRVDATEADIAEAQLKVESAQAAVAQAQRDAAEAALAASNAQATANKAQQDVAALTKRVVSAETAITQNSEQIRLAATKTEEIGNAINSQQSSNINLWRFTKDYDGSKYNKWGQIYNSNIAYKNWKPNTTIDCFGVQYINHEWDDLSQCVPIKHGGTYTLSAMVKLGSNTSSVGVYIEGATIQQMLVNGVKQVTIKNVIDNLSATEYKRVSVTYKNTGNKDYSYIRFEPTTNSTMYMYQPMFNEGYPLPWSPHPEDHQSQIDGINNNLSNNYYSKTQTDAAIKVASDNVTTTVRKEVTTEITNVNNKVNNLSIGSDNLIVNGGFPTDTHGWKNEGSGRLETRVHPFYFNNKKNMFCIITSKQVSGSEGQEEDIAYSNWFNVKPNTDYTLSFVGFSSSNVVSTEVHYMGKLNKDDSGYSNIITLFTKAQMPASYCQYYKYTFNSGNSNVGSIRFDNNGSTDGAENYMFFSEVMLVEGAVAKKYQPSSADMAEQAKNAQDAANSAQSAADGANSRVSVAESTIKQLSDSISMLVTDKNGSSMMTQTSNGWTFNMGAITDAIDSATNNIDNLSGSLSQTNNVVNNLNNLANDLSKKTAYINMTTDENGAPCIELGKTGNAFKVRITNTSVDFIEGSSKIAYVSNQALFIEKAIIKSELQIGEKKGFIWKTRSNGNMGLRWFG